MSNNYEYISMLVSLIIIQNTFLSNTKWYMI